MKQKQDFSAEDEKINKLLHLKVPVRIQTTLQATSIQKIV